MSAPAHGADALSQVVAFYDAHPINEEQILHTLQARGISLQGLTEDTLKEFDQDHFGGTAVNDILAQAAGLNPSHHVLDVCSGMGGPARYFAHYYGCRVTGLDFTYTRFVGARRLTEMVGLQQRVDFRHGNALDMPFPDASFDAVVGQEAWCHVPDKPRLIAECARVLKPGGVLAFTDILRRDGLGAEEMVRLQREMTFSTLETLDGYRDLLASQGCALQRCDDLSEEWARILLARLAMYRSLKHETVQKFGAAHFSRWDDTYAFFVGLYGQGKLGGGRFVARKGLSSATSARASRAPAR